MKDFLEKNWQYVLLALVVLAVVIYIMAEQHTIRVQQEQIFALQLAQGDSLRANVNRILNLRKDTATVNNTKIFYLERKKENEEEKVVTTNNIDTLIDLYFLHRSRVGSYNTESNLNKNGDAIKNRLY